MDERYFSSPNVQTGSGAYPDSYSWSSGEIYPEVKQSRRDVESLHSVPRSRMSGAILLLPIHASMSSTVATSVFLMPPLRHEVQNDSLLSC
jgi:hypothetical protein